MYAVRKRSSEAIQVSGFSSSWALFAPLLPVSFPDLSLSSEDKMGHRQDQGAATLQGSVVEGRVLRSCHVYVRVLPHT